MPIVKPEWIVDSIRAGKCLSKHSYVIDCLKVDNQPTLEFDRKGKAKRMVEEFFKKSRLHHIGSMRTHFQQQEKRQHDGDIVRPDSMPRIILHADMDCFFVSVATRDRPELNCCPVAVAHSNVTSNGKGYSEVSSCNYFARDFGVKAGMMMKRVGSIRW